MTNLASGRRRGRKEEKKPFTVSRMDDQEQQESL
jgi:hypothetical protein